jgi:hypothetical protein
MRVSDNKENIKATTPVISPGNLDQEDKRYFVCKEQAMVLSLESCHKLRTRRSARLTSGEKQLMRDVNIAYKTPSACEGCRLYSNTTISRYTQEQVAQGEHQAELEELVKKKLMANRKLLD